MADADTTPRQDTETIPLDDTGDVQLPIVDVLTGRAFLTGKSGSGKSNTASVIAKELPVKVDFDTAGIATIKETMRRREEAERIMENL